MTRNKLNVFAKRLDSHEKFLKNNYVSEKKSIESTVKELYDEYLHYTMDKHYSKVEFCRKLREFGIDHYKSSSELKYKISIEVLNSLAIKFN